MSNLRLNDVDLGAEGRWVRSGEPRRFAALNTADPVRYLSLASALAHQSDRRARIAGSGLRTGGQPTDREMAEMALGLTRQQPPTRRAPASSHSLSCSAVKASPLEVPVHVRAAPSQVSPLLG